LDVFYEGLGISKLPIFDIKKKNLSAVNILATFGHQNPGSGLDADADPESTNPDPKH
jgi:hypothetical protein